MKKFTTTLYIIFSVVLLFYVALPNLDFPLPPPGAVQSKEPADTETLLRRAYFTDLTRAEVLNWYDIGFNKTNFRFPTYLMNYPPEESGSIIRDQTRSTFLQEFVHPMRESLYVNGYEPAPTDDVNRIIIDGVHYRQKIIVRFIPSNVFLRLFVTLITLVLIPVLFNAFVPELIFFKDLIFKKRKK